MKIIITNKESLMLLMHNNSIEAIIVSFHVSVAYYNKWYDTFSTIVTNKQLYFFLKNLIEIIS